MTRIARALLLCAIGLWLHVSALGQSSTLSWSETGATSLTLNPGNINVTGRTSYLVSPHTTTTYTLTATNSSGSTSLSVTVTCTTVPPAIPSLTSSPAIIAPGGSSTLSWSTTGLIDTQSIDQGIGSVSGNSKPVSPATTTIYTLSVANAAGTASRSTTVTVGNLPSIASFSSSPGTVTPGNPNTLSWSVSGATSLSINQGVGTVTGTSVVVNPTGTITYILTATNAVGSVTKSLTLWQPPVISSFASSPSSITSGSTSSLNWVTSGATSLSINQGIGTVSGSSSVPVSPIVTTVYTLSATNPGGTTTATATVTVAASVPAIASFSVNPTVLLSGNAAILSWSVTGATSLSIDNGVGTVTGSSISVSPTTNTTYHLTATNGTGSSSAAVTVMVIPAVCH